MKGDPRNTGDSEPLAVAESLSASVLTTRTVLGEGRILETLSDFRNEEGLHSFYCAWVSAAFSPHQEDKGVASVPVMVTHEITPG